MGDGAEAGGVAGFLVSLAPLVLLTLTMLVPYVKILRKLKRSPWWSLVLFIPIFGIFIMPWIVAGSDWRRLEGGVGAVFD